MVRRLRKSLDCPTVTVDWTRKRLPHWNLLICPLLDLPRCKRLNRLHPRDYQTIGFPTPTFRPRLILTRLADLDRCCQMFPPNPTLRQWSHGLNLTHTWHMAAGSITPLCKGGPRHFTSKSTQLAISLCVSEFCHHSHAVAPHLATGPATGLSTQSNYPERYVRCPATVEYGCLTM
jgi:hypothetical protein